MREIVGAHCESQPYAVEDFDRLLAATAGSTDGITDLPPPHGILPTELAALVHELRELPTAHDIADAIHHSLLERVPDRSRRDDVALLVVRVDSRSAFVAALADAHGT